MCYIKVSFNMTSSFKTCEVTMKSYMCAHAMRYIQGNMLLYC